MILRPFSFLVLQATVYVLLTYIPILCFCTKQWWTVFFTNSRALRTKMVLLEIQLVILVPVFKEKVAI